MGADLEKKSKLLSWMSELQCVFLNIVAAKITAR